MSTSNKPLKVVFAPGVLEQMEQDFEPDELQAALDEIAKLAENPSIGTLVDMNQLMLEDPLLYHQLVTQLESVESGTEDKPTLQ